MTAREDLARLLDRRLAGEMPPGGWLWLVLDYAPKGGPQPRIVIPSDESLDELDLRGCAGLSVDLVCCDPSLGRLRRLLTLLTRVPLRSLAVYDLGIKPRPRAAAELVRHPARRT